MLPRRYHAFSRALEQQSTLLPFLYQTRTIARHYTTASPDPIDEALDSAVEDHASRHRPPRQHGYQRPNHHRHRFAQGLIDHVPFEGSKTSQHANSDFEGSTITPGERKAFEGLFKLKEGGSGQDGKEVGNSRQDQQERRQEANKNRSPRPSPNPNGQSLENTMESAGRDEIRKDNATYPRALQRMANDAEKRHKRDQEPSQSDAIDKAAATDKSQFMAALDKAQTDAEVWDVLQEKVFKRVVALNLDELSKPLNPTKLNKKKKKKKRAEQDVASTPAPQRPVSELEILTQTLNQYLIYAHTHLTTLYPHSPLPLTILPYLRTLGPSAFALGASTHLYNLHLRCLYARYRDLDGIIATLREMDEMVYPFDEASEVVVTKALAHARLAETKGGLGEGVREWWEGQGMRRKVKRLVWWGRRVRERREEEALRRSRLEMEEDGESEEGENDVGIRSAV